MLGIEPQSWGRTNTFKHWSVAPFPRPFCAASMFMSIEPSSRTWKAYQGIYQKKLTFACCCEFVSGSATMSRMLWVCPLFMLDFDWLDHVASIMHAVIEAMSSFVQYLCHIWKTRFPWCGPGQRYPVVAHSILCNGNDLNPWTASLQINSPLTKTAECVICDSLSKGLVLIY